MNIDARGVAEAISREVGGPVTKSGGGFQVRCIAHDDKDPSLSLKDGDNGRLLWHCHAGCSQERVGTELRERGLLPEATPAAKAKAKKRAKAEEVNHAKRVSQIAEADVTAGRDRVWSDSDRATIKKSESLLLEERSGWEDLPVPGDVAPAPGREPYPIEVFPDIAQAAAIEVQQYIKSPIDMIGCAALGQMSLLAQALADVGRDERLIGSCSIYVLIQALSGERKTQLDGLFSKVIKEWMAKQREKRLPDYRKSKAMQQALNERRQSVIKKIGAVEAKGGAESEAERKVLEERLMDLEEQDIKLQTFPLPHLYFADVTTEALIYYLAKGWPFAMMSSAEGGIVLGGHGMKEEAALAFQAVLNMLWDGDDIVQVRKQAKAADVIGRRFSLSLMIQPELFQKITDKGGRGVGFLARTLLAYPESTMGTRLYTPPPADMPALSRFNERARVLLELPLPVNDRFELEPPVMMLSPGALTVWRDYHDAVESEMGVYGELSHVRDVGSKSAENAARIACVFQIWGEGPGGQITADYMKAGVAVASWHLMEASRIFFEADKPQELQDAELLSQWLTKQAPSLTRSDGSPMLDERGCMPVADILRYGPYRFRKDKARRDAALIELAAEDVFHIRSIKDGRRKLLQVNPWLLK
ncbi:MAG: DUF3987 domain-containing protein [gamma proteobacterium endosymbiont of Lamellibrachia anaximandri]|nr:DUF3987 domain-containing protein [gamma proteobacterium endosymbiont of Lamellibrachia anaximandri]MBL3616224.1 DUF3987 domain-containing protein [gamma proteobacterium endosymbiont of Lamellibrachia anaximandri]